MYKLLFSALLFLSCASTRTIIVPLGDYPSYKKTMEGRGETFVKADTLKAADGKMVIIYFHDRP